jgi:hypothetical protein
MTEDTALLEKRDELKRQLDTGEYKTLIDVVLDETGRLVQRFTRSPQPVPFWVSAVIIAALTLLIGLLAWIASGEFDPSRREDILMGLSMVVLALAGMVLAKIAQGILFTTLRDHLLDEIESEADLTGLQRWLAAHYDIRKRLWFSLAYDVLMASYTVATASID